MQDQKSDDKEEVEPRAWTKRVELSIFEGVDPQRNSLKSIRFLLKKD